MLRALHLVIPILVIQRTTFGTIIWSRELTAKNKLIVSTKLILAETSHQQLLSPSGVGTTWPSETPQLSAKSLHYSREFLFCEEGANGPVYLPGWSLSKWELLYSKENPSHSVTMTGGGRLWADSQNNLLVIPFISLLGLGMSSKSHWIWSLKIWI